MHKFIQRVIQKELGESVLSIREINGLGSVNQVFDVEGSTANYIIRLNEDPAKQVEYQKEKWCLDKLKTVNVPAPVILAMGMFDKVLFMIQEKIPGINGAYCKPKEKLEIWKQLGQYARKYQHIFQIEDEQVGAAEFHDNWKARLIYNINKLAVADSLLKNGVFNKNQQQIVRIALENLKSKTYKVGLVHGDLSLRNCIWNDGQVYLLDWGTAEINVVPHNEIGILQMSDEASEEEIYRFLKGLGLSRADYNEIKAEINVLNLLHRLDKYRWAVDHNIRDIKNYEDRIKKAFRNLNPL